jgi:putative ABC transport system ATP-binding protein
MAMQAVETHDIAMEFGKGQMATRVLHDINVTVELGRLTMLVGPSGCGKTTLLSIMSGTLRPTGGDVDVMGQRITRMTDGAKVKFRRRAIGFIFQQYNLLPSLTAAENAAAPLVADGMPLGRAARKAAEVLEGLGMAPHVNKLPRQLSGGQQQRIAIARAVVHAPALIVCDEPTAALDAQTGHTVMELLKTASADPGRAVLVVTHDNRIYDFADRIVSMEDGRIVGDTASTAKGFAHA